MKTLKQILTCKEILEDEEAQGISPKSLGLKLAGKRDFKWDEVCLIQSRFFPDIDKDTLFMAAEEKKGA